MLVNIQGLLSPLRFYQELLYCVDLLMRGECGNSFVLREKYEVY